MGAVITSSPTSSMTARPLVERKGRNAQLARLNLAGVHRLDHDAADDAGTDVGAAAARMRKHIRLYVFEYPLHALGRHG